MFTQTQAILDYLVAKITAIPSLTGYNIHRDDYITLSSDVLPAVLIYPHIDKKEVMDETNSNKHETRILTCVIEIRMIGHPVSTTTMPVLNVIGQALMNDTTLGGTAYYCRVNQVQWIGEKSDKNYASAGLTVDIIYRTKP